jgi:GNAT superfamily N-acetyltransferase
MTRDKASLVHRQAFFADAAARAGYAALMQAVFDIDVDARDALAGIDPTCRPFALFDASGACIASVEALALPLILDGYACAAAAIRSVAVAEAWRGHGLFRSLMAEALAWCDATFAGPALLYTAESSLYERVGFCDVPQHKVVGPAPVVDARADLRRLSLARPADVALIRRLLDQRAPVSDHVAVTGGAAVFMTQIAANAAMDLDYAGALDALVVSNQTAKSLVLVDIVAPVIPALARVLAVLGRSFDRVEILFPADKLAWSGRVERDDTGLMIRGPWPTAFNRPFMLPPTAEF